MSDITENKQIPHKIYYCWFGGNKPQNILDCVNNWHEKLPDYEIIEINENNTEHFNVEEECKKNKWFRVCYEQKIWALVSDYARLKVLYENGGIYFDTDITIEDDIKALINKNKFVAGWECNKYINAAVLISLKNDKNIKQMFEFYDEKIWKEPIYTIPAVVTKILRQNYNLKKYSQITENDDILILPPDYCYPIPVGLHNITRKDIGNFKTNETITVHWNSGNWSSHGSNNVIFFGTNKHKMSFDKLIELCFIEKTIIENPFIKITKICTSLNVNINWYWLCRFKYRSDINKNRWLVLFLFGFQIKIYMFEKGEDRLC